MTDKDLDTRTNEDPEGFASKGAKKIKPLLPMVILSACVVVSAGLQFYRSPNDQEEEKDKIRADYCQMMEDRYDPKILTEIYAPGTKQSCYMFLADYQEE